MKTSRTEKEMNSIVESVFYGLSYGILVSIRRIFRGAWRMRGWKVAGFPVSVAFGAAIRLHKDAYLKMAAEMGMPGWVKAAVFYMLLAVPVWYLLILGLLQDLQQARYDKEFAAIGFKDREGRFPVLVKKSRDRKGLKKSRKYKEIFIFRSNIPIGDWIASQKKIETALDRNIIRFTEGSSKKICKAVAVPPECRIPQRIDWEDSKIREKDGVVVLGEGALEVVAFDLNRTPHVLAAGETGSGKSVILRACLWQLVKKGAKVYMIDFKGGVEFGKRYEKFGEVITQRERALEVLQELCLENEKRLALFRDMEAKNLPEYNRKAGKNLCRIGVFCDEIAEMLDKKGAAKGEREVMEKLEGLVSSLARLSRATGINLFLGVQRPDANVLTGQIKNNIPVRICGRFADKAASEIVLGNTDAVYLPDIKGRFLFRLGNVTEEFQAYYFDDDRDLTGDAPEPGEMLIHAGNGGREHPAGQDRMDQDARMQEEEVKGPEETFFWNPEKARKDMERAERPAEKLAAGQEAFDFTWSCEGKDKDG